MKKILSILLLTLSSTAFAQHHHGHYGHHGYYRPGYGWIFPVIVGGVIGYEVARSQSPVIVQQPAVIQSAPVITQECSPWHETQQANGTITRERTCYQR